LEPIGNLLGSLLMNQTQPVIFGGGPTETANMVVLPRKSQAAVTLSWN
jgi:hypothetical protein